MEWAIVGSYALNLVLGTLTFLAWVEIKAMKSSTHQVQFIKGGEYEALTEELKEKLTKDPFDSLQ